MIFRVRNLRLLAAAIAAVVLSSPALAQTGVLAPTPPMGWNSWDAYGLTINEAQFKANADVLASRLKAAGYTYAVVDEVKQTACKEH